MARGDLSGAVKFAAPYPRLVAMLGVTSFSFAPYLLISPDADRLLSPAAKHVLGAIALVAGIAACIWGWSRAWRMGLLLDNHGVTVRNFRRISRFSRAEVRCFADGSWEETSESGSRYLWALDVVLHEGRVVTAWATARKHPCLETLTPIQQAASCYGIPAALTGEVTKRESPADAVASGVSPGDDPGEAAEN